MPRKLRFNLAGIPQHVIQRGNNRQACFFAEQDYRFYLDCLAEAAREYECAIHAYVLMTNHVHLLVSPNSPPGIARMMQSLGRRYVHYVNYVYKRSGTLWEGLYKASLVDAENYLLTCYRYIELNPVRANMVEQPEDYQWSSYRSHAYGASKDFLQDHPLYDALGAIPEARQEAYRGLFRHQLDPTVLGELREALNQGLVTGGDRFKCEIEAMLRRRVRPLRRGRPTTQVEEHVAAEGLNDQLSFMEER